MRLTVRRFTPGAVFSSFLGILDIKLGCEIILLFGLINKVAGVYGLVTFFIGATFIQYCFYAYSIATLFAFLWALGVVKTEIAKKALLVSHLYFLDHFIVTVFHYLFYYRYWFVLDHDGKRELNSQAQKDIYELAFDRGETGSLTADTAESANLAREIWQSEKGYAVAVILVGFLMKVYFITTLYSYAAHLRSGGYHSLPLTSNANTARAIGQVPVPSAADGDDNDEIAYAEADIARIDAADAANASPRHSPHLNGSDRMKGRTQRGADDDEFSWD